MIFLRFLLLGILVVWMEANGADIQAFKQVYLNAPSKMIRLTENSKVDNDVENGLKEVSRLGNWMTRTVKEAILEVFHDPRVDWQNNFKIYFEGFHFDGLKSFHSAEEYITQFLYKSIYLGFPYKEVHIHGNLSNPDNSESLMEFSFQIPFDGQGEIKFPIWIEHRKMDGFFKGIHNLLPRTFIPIDLNELPLEFPVLLEEKMKRELGREVKEIFPNIKEQDTFLLAEPLLANHWELFLAQLKKSGRLRKVVKKQLWNKGGWVDKDDYRLPFITTGNFRLILPDPFTPMIETGLLGRFKRRLLYDSKQLFDGSLLWLTDRRRQIKVYFHNGLVLIPVGTQLTGHQVEEIFLETAKLSLEVKRKLKLVEEKEPWWETKTIGVELLSAL